MIKFGGGITTYFAEPFIFFILHDMIQNFKYISNQLVHIIVISYTILNYIATGYHGKFYDHFRLTDMMLLSFTYGQVIYTTVLR